jgi:type VI secretion system protein ImpG
MFSKYYEAELAYLRELGRGYAQLHPATAGLLAERSGDPDVERLLEGVAFLAARIRERTDDAVPEVVHGVADLLLPHYLRPIPACTILEFVPQTRALRSALTVERGIEVASVPVEGTACIFRTTQEVTLLPVTLGETVLEMPSATSALLRVQVNAPGQGREELLKASSLRFFLHGDYALVATLFLWMFRHCRSISLGEPGSAAPGVKLPEGSLRPVSFTPQAALFPWPRMASEGYRIVQEYFTLPQKFLFFDLANLADAAGAVKEHFELRFEFERPPALQQRVPRDVLRLHCTPAINLFRAEAEPARVEASGQEQLVRASGVDPRAMEVYSVDEVVSLRPNNSERELVRPFTDFGHVGSSDVFYHLRRSLSPIDEGVDTYISLESPRDVPPRLEERTLSMQLTCTNRSHPGKLRIGEVNVPTPTSPMVARFTNLLPVSQPLHPPLGSELLWRVIAHLALVKRSLAEPKLLASVLGLYNFQVLGDEPVGRANTRRIEAVGSVEVSPSRQLFQGAIVRGQRTLVHLEETGFVGPGDLFLFGWVLDELFAANLTLNAFHSLRVRQNPSKTEYAWTPRTGSQPLA